MLSLDDWRADGYRWFQYGTKKLPRHEPVISKSYFISVTPAGHNHEFKRCAYKLIDPKSPLVLVHYFGDESIAVGAPHGNAKIKPIFPKKGIEKMAKTRDGVRASWGR